MLSVPRVGSHCSRRLCCVIRDGALNATVRGELQMGPERQWNQRCRRGRGRKGSTAGTLHDASSLLWCLA